jgi:hypothetical protein
MLPPSSTSKWLGSGPIGTLQGQWTKWYMGGRKESTECVNRYKMNKRNSPLLGLWMGRKNKAITIQCPWQYKKKEETAYPESGGGDTVDEKSKWERNSPIYEATLHSYYYWQWNNLTGRNRHQRIMWIVLKSFIRKIVYILATAHILNLLYP